MAETALCLLESFLRRAVFAAAEEFGSVLGVQEEVWYIKDELMTMKVFLTVVEQLLDKDPMLKPWMEQVGNLVYDIEDCLEESAIIVHHPGWFHKILNHLAYRKLATQICAIKTRVHDVSERNRRYDLHSCGHDLSDLLNKVDDGYEMLHRHEPPLYEPRVEHVGCDNEKNKLIKCITGTNTSLQVIAVTGMVGIGKSALVNQVLRSTQIAGKFDCTQPFNIDRLIETTVSKLLADGSKRRRPSNRQSQVANGSRRFSSDHMRIILHNRMFFIVFDDLWTYQHWDKIKQELPMSSHSGSRIVVTTRDVHVAMHCIESNDHIVNLKRLDEQHSIILLTEVFRKVRNKNMIKDKDLARLKSLGNMYDEVINNEFADKDMLEECDGLPLAIIVTAGILPPKQCQEWKNVLARFPLEIESHPMLEKLNTLMTLRYRYMPPYLKPCFLYPSIFAEGFEIKRTHIVKRWVAEGYIRDMAGRTLEKTAEGYFYELIDRNLVQPMAWDKCQMVSRCRIRPIMRQVVVRIAKEENLVFTIEERNTVTPPRIFRHLALDGKSFRGIIDNLNLTCIRSLTVFGEPAAPIAWYILHR